MSKYKAGQKLTYKPHNAEVTVVHNSLKAGGVNSEEAYVTVVTKNGLLFNVPVEVQDQYLSTAPPVKVSVIKKIFGQAS